MTSMATGPAQPFSNIMGVPEGTPTHGACSPEEWAARVDLAMAYRLLDHFRMTDLTHTHISARVPGTTDQFLQLPYGHLFCEATASNMVKCDLAGQVISDPTGLGISVGGFRIHSAIHAARHDANVVVHVHTRATVAVCCQKRGLLPLTQHAMRFADRIAYLDYSGTFDDSGKQRSIADALGDAQVLMLRNHGPLAVGRTVAEAFSRIYYLERACDMQLALQASGQEVVMPRPTDVEFMAEAFEDHDLREASLEWAALTRMMHRRYAGFDA